MIQHLGRIARRHLRQHLEPGLADHLVMHLVGQTNGLLHFASLYALLPLLDDEGIFRFQQWHQGFLDSQDMPEPASGSGSRDPR